MVNDDFNNRLVSICIPAYNAAKYINETINSILMQTYLHLEVIIVDDGSTDATLSVIGEFVDDRLKIIESVNRGQCAAANLAFASARGELIKFMDADDLISPSFIENQVRRIGNRSDAVVSASWGRFYNDDRSTFKLSYEDVWRDLPADEWLVNSWKGANSMMQCALWLIPRSILEKSGLWDESLSLINDFDFFTRVLLNSREVLFEKDAILYYRSGIPGSLSGTKSSESIYSAFRSIGQATENLLRVRSDTAARLSCANTWQQLVYMLYPQYPEITDEAEKRIALLGGASLPFAIGGWSGFLLKITGWKFLKHLKHFFKK